MEKTCFKCGEIKPFIDFYKHKSTIDGYLNKCKVCTKNDVHKYRKENIDKIREYDRNRPNKADRLEKQAEYLKTEKGKEVRRRATQNFRKDKVKYKAHRDLGNALKYGNIEKPSNCENCKTECSPHGHHDDYAKPLDVRWLCTKCHTDFHNHVREKERELEKQGLSDLFDSHKLIKHVAKTYWKNK